MATWPGANGGPPVIPPAVIIDSRRLAQIGQYLGAAGYIILTHDILILLPRELSTVWRAKSSFLKWAYLIDRYFTWCFQTLVMIGMSTLFGFTLRGKFCQFLTYGLLVFFIPSMAISNLLVIFRIVNVWKRNRVVRNFIFIFWFISLIISFTVLPALHLSAAIHSSQNPFILNAFGSYCVIARTDRLGLVGLAVSNLFDTTMLILACVNSFSRPRGPNERLYDFLVEDSAFYFLGLTILRLGNILVGALVPYEVFPGSVVFSWTVTTTLMGRFLVGIRSQSNPPNTPESSVGSALDLKEISSVTHSGHESTTAGETTVTTMYDIRDIDDR